MKTHAQDSNAVEKTIDLVTAWFLKIHCSGRLIPSDFDFLFFFKGVNMLLDLDHSYSTAKVIWMLYQTLHIIEKKQRDQFLEKMLEP
jgi:hypothetical protein